MSLFYNATDYRSALKFKRNAGILESLRHLFDNYVCFFFFKYDNASTTDQDMYSAGLYKHTTYGYKEPEST